MTQSDLNIRPSDTVDFWQSSDTVKIATLISHSDALTQQLADVTAERDALAKRVEGLEGIIQEIKKGGWTDSDLNDFDLESLNPTQGGEVSHDR